MTIGNRFISIFLGCGLALGSFRFIHRLMGGWMLLDILSVLNLRGRVSGDRRHFEREILSGMLCGHAPVLLVGVKSYNYHYILGYKALGVVDVVEPNRNISVPSAVERWHCLIQDWQPKLAYYGLIDCVGVYGYGLDNANGLVAALSGFSRGLRGDGRLLFSINNGHDPLGLLDSRIREHFFHEFVEHRILMMDAGVILLFVKAAAGN